MKSARTLLIAIEAWMEESESLSEIAPTALRAYAQAIEDGAAARSAMERLRITQDIEVKAVYLMGLQATSTHRMSE